MKLLKTLAFSIYILLSVEVSRALDWTSGYSVCRGIVDSLLVKAFPRPQDPFATEEAVDLRNTLKKATAYMEAAARQEGQFERIRVFLRIATQYHEEAWKIFRETYGEAAENEMGELIRSLRTGVQRVDDLSRFERKRLWDFANLNMLRLIGVSHAKVVALTAVWKQEMEKQVEALRSSPRLDMYLAKKSIGFEWEKKFHVFLRDEIVLESAIETLEGILPEFQKEVDMKLGRMRLPELPASVDGFGYENEAYFYRFK